MDIISTIFRAHEEIKINISSENEPEASDLLVQCQQAAITVGEYIEEIEGEGSIIVKKLEVYCDVVYKMNDLLTTQTEDRDFVELSGKIFDQLEKPLNEIRGMIENFPLRLEIVFFPYKASMWDSLESVWKAAYADPDCDAFVVPIPYFEKKSDGTLGEMHYEGSDFPDYVPITPYGEYDFTVRRPDAMFIHNPYDEYNNVTSVHPLYYSTNLNKYTDKLVYIPYFISSISDEKCKKDPKVLLGNLGVPGVFNSDLVILQSEIMKEAAVAALSGLRDKKADRPWERIISGIGSPKLDKVMELSGKNQNIPKEWGVIISDNKPIILYNTGVTSLLEASEKLLNKLERDFEIYMKNKEICTLIWRPHPLIETTISAMRPELKDQYERIKKCFLENQIGIYDDTPDGDRAVALCDVFTGDFSSLDVMCRTIGKKVVYNTAEVMELAKKFEKKETKMLDYVPCGEKIYDSIKKELLKR